MEFTDEDADAMRECLRMLSLTATPEARLVMANMTQLHIDQRKWLPAWMDEHYALLASNGDAERAEALLSKMRKAREAGQIRTLVPDRVRSVELAAWPEAPRLDPGSPLARWVPSHLRPESFTVVSKFKPLPAPPAKDAELPKADWDLWVNIASASIHELVALSLDLHPWSWEDRSAERMLPKDLRQAFTNRLTVAVNHWTAPGAPRVPPDRITVTLGEFAAWAESLPEPWDLPARFPRPGITPAERKRGRLALEGLVDESLRHCIGFVSVIASATARHAGKDEAFAKELSADLWRWIREGRIKTRNETTGATEGHPSRQVFLLLHIDDVNAEFERQGMPWRCPSLAPSTEAAPDPRPPLRSNSRHRQQEGAVLAAIAELGHEATALPPLVPGKPGVKADVRRHLSGRGDFAGDTVFKKAWERLSEQGRIGYAPKGGKSMSEVAPSPKSGDRGRVAGEKA